MLYLYTAVSSSKDETKVTVTTPPDMSNPEPREEEITYAEHDFREFKKLAPQQIITILIMTVMHWKYDFVRPIVMQSVMLPITILKMPLVKVRVRPRTKALGPPFFCFCFCFCFLVLWEKNIVRVRGKHRMIE